MSDSVIRNKEVTLANVQNRLSSLILIASNTSTRLYYNPLKQEYSLFCGKGLVTPHTYSIFEGQLAVDQYNNRIRYTK